VWAQDLERDPAKYARPIVLVAPDPPQAVLHEHGHREYVVSFHIGTKGLVEGDWSVSPPDPEFRAELDKVVRFWVFYPNMNKQCEPGERDGRIGFDFQAAEKSPRVWAEIAKLQGLDANSRSFGIAYAPPPPEYPSIEAGWRPKDTLVNIAMKVMPDGTTTDHLVLMAVPAKGAFGDVALEHAKGYRLKPIQPSDDRPYVCAIVPYVFRLR